MSIGPRQTDTDTGHEPYAASRYDCPTCGQPVSIYTADEGTSSYVGEAESALRMLLSWQPSAASVLEHLHPQHREAVENARRVIGDDIPF